MKKILVIDDDVLVLKSVKNLLKRSSYDVTCVNDGKQAIENVSNEDFNLVICDMRMPGQDGLSVVNEIQAYLKRKNRSQVPFLFITGYASEEAPIEAIKLGAKDYILKPFDLDELIESVAKNIR